MSLESIDAKILARQAAAGVRELVHRASGEHGPLALAALPLPVAICAGANIVSGFYPTMSEIDTRPLLGKLAGEGWVTCLPVIIARGVPLAFRRWYAGEPTVAGKWGIARPPDDAPVVEPDVMLVPLLAFDRQGYRLGYGGGFYDRTIQALRAKKTIVAIGVGYAAQEIDAVPRDDHDQPLDYMMTENGVFACG